MFAFSALLFAHANTRTTNNAPRTQLEDRPGILSSCLQSVGEAGGNIGAIDIVRYASGSLIRDVTIDTTSVQHQHEILRYHPHPRPHHPPTPHTTPHPPPHATANSTA